MANVRFRADGDRTLATKMGAKRTSYSLPNYNSILTTDMRPYWSFQTNWGGPESRRSMKL